MNRIRILALALVLCLLMGCTATTLPASDNPAPDEQAAPEQTVQEADETTPKKYKYTLAQSAEDSLNPFTAKSSVNRQLLGLIYDGLFATAGDGSTVHLLCAAFEASSDLKSYTFYLRQNVLMHDGSLMTEQDVIDSLNQARKSDRYGFRLRHIASVLSVQPGTVTVQLATPYEHLEKLLDVPIFRSGTAEEATPPGTGPYRKSGRKLQRFSSCWRSETALDLGSSISLRSADTAQQLCSAFTDGKLSVACVDLNGTATPIYHCAYDLYTYPTQAMQYLGFNTMSGMFRSEALRQAVTYLIDRETLTAELGSSFAAAAVLPANPRSDSYDRSLALDYDYNPDDYYAALEAAEIHDLDADGVLDLYIDQKLVRAEGRLMVCSAYPERVSAAERIAKELQRYGIELSVHSLSESAYRSALKNGNYDLYYGETLLPPDGDLSVFFDTRSTLCLPGMASEAMLLLCDNALENSGNFYTLYESIMDQGLLCPVLFKQLAVYVQQGLPLPLTPGYSNLYLTSP